MDITKITKAAQAEHRAEQRRTQSDAAWRTAWWNLGLLLADVVGQTEVSKVNKLVKEELGCSLDYLGQRRKTAKALKSELELGLIELAEVQQLPPRLAIAWINDLKRERDGMVAALRSAAKEELSLREFIAAHGGRPMSTGKERFTPTPPAPATREEKVAAAREALADDDVATEVMRDVNTARAARRAAGTAAAQEHEARQRDRDVADPKAAKEQAEDREQVGRMMARVNLESFLRHAKRDGISALACWGEIQGLASQVDRDLLLDILDEAMNPFAALKDALKTNHNIDAELAAFLAEGDD